jgi:hypothetical protein
VALDFKFYPLKLTFRARERLKFPAGKATNVLRGAFGMLLEGEPYQRLFSPSLSEGPSGLADAPRPFVIRAAHLDGVVVEPGESFWFQFHYFETRQPRIEEIVRAFGEWNRAELIDASCRSLTLDLECGTEVVPRLLVRFRTPTELKVEGGLAVRPEFGILAARVRDRISTLRSLYGEGALEIDFRAFADCASRVRITRCELLHFEAERRSSRTGQRHSIGGFTGEVSYEGDLARFVPYLKAAQWTGVGRQTVWGKGEIEVLSGSPSS